MASVIGVAFRIGVFACAVLLGLTQPPKLCAAASSDQPADELLPLVNIATPTHAVAARIAIVGPGPPWVRTKCFCVLEDSRILVACQFYGSTEAERSGEIRIFDSTGRHSASWPLPFAPEAICQESKGTVLIAGAGRLIRMTVAGQELLSRPSPQSADVELRRDEYRHEIVREHQQAIKARETTRKWLDDQVCQCEKRLSAIDDQISALRKMKEADGSDETLGLEYLDARRSSLVDRLARAEEMRRSWLETQAKLPQPEELSSEEIEKLLEKRIVHRSTASSLCGDGENVYVIYPSVAESAQEVWRMKKDFSAGEVLVGRLSASRHVDLQASDQGVYIMEGAEYRVSRYTYSGKLEKRWGKKDPKSLEGFCQEGDLQGISIASSGHVYTSEIESGRIKRYSPDGVLLGLVALDDSTAKSICVGPIAVSSDGEHVYRLDQLRKQIIRLDRVAADPSPVAVAEYHRGKVKGYELSYSWKPSGGKFSKTLIKEKSVPENENEERHVEEVREPATSGVVELMKLFSGQAASPDE